MFSPGFRMCSVGSYTTYQYTNNDLERLHKRPVQKHQHKLWVPHLKATRTA